MSTLLYAFFFGDVDTTPDSAFTMTLVRKNLRSKLRGLVIRFESISLIEPIHLPSPDDMTLYGRTGGLCSSGSPKGLVNAFPILYASRSQAFQTPLS